MRTSTPKAYCMETTGWCDMLCRADCHEGGKRALVGYGGQKGLPRWSARCWVRKQASVQQLRNCGECPASMVLSSKHTRIMSPSSMLQSGPIRITNAHLHRDSTTVVDKVSNRSLPCMMRIRPPMRNRTNVLALAEEKPRYYSLATCLFLENVLRRSLLSCNRFVDKRYTLRRREGSSIRQAFVLSV